MSTGFSRRRALQAGFSAAVFPLLASKQATAQIATETNWNNLSVTPSTDSSFSSLMQQHFPGLLEEPGVDALSSLFYVLINNSNLPLTALQVKWTFHTANSSETAHDVEVVRSGLDRWYTGAVPLMGAGVVRLLTPFFCWSPEAYEATSKPINWQKALTSNETMRYRSFHMTSVMQVDMHPTNAVWNNQFVTENPEGEFARKLIVTRNGEHDAAYDVKRQIKAGADKAAIDQFLSQRTLPAVSKNRTAVERRYVEARRRESLLLLQTLRDKPFSKFEHIIKRISSEPRTVLMATPQA